MSPYVKVRGPVTRLRHLKKARYEWTEVEKEQFLQVIRQNNITTNLDGQQT